MKTSPSQFEFMVTFMEQHGDLSKPTSNARGRLSSMRSWEELANFLNSDGSGDTKSIEKWKKVWSDYKNNTKKKAARLHRAALGTGGGPAVHSKLTDLEERVLNLMGVQAATGLKSVEAGLLQINIQPNANESHEQEVQTPPLQNVLENSQNEAVGSVEATISSPPHTFVEADVQISECWNQPGPSTYIAPVLSPQTRPATGLLPSFMETQIEDPGSLTPTRPTSEVYVIHPEPAVSRQTTPRRARATRTRGSPRRRMRPTHTEQAAQHFLQSDERWRTFKIQQHKDDIDIKKEKLRIRELELQTQREWQSLGLRALGLIDKLVNKYCNN